MPQSHLLTYGIDGRVHSAWHTRTDALDYMAHYNQYREMDAWLHYNVFEIGSEKKQPQDPGWYCEISLETGEIVTPPRVHSFTPERRPKHMIAANTGDKLAVVSFESAEHAEWAAKQERARHFRKGKA